MNSRRPLTLSLDSAVYAGLERRAQAMGRRVGDFALMLMEAAYSARVGIERQQPAVDAEMDQAVRAVFCMAGQVEPASIAKATGLSRETVDNVLRGLNRVARETASPGVGQKKSQAKASEDNGRITGGAGPVTGEASRPVAGRSATATSETKDATVVGDQSGTLAPPGPIPPGLARPASRLTPEQLDWASNRWTKDNWSVGRISQALNLTQSSFGQLVFKDRRLFPKRSAA